MAFHHMTGISRKNICTRPLLLFCVAALVVSAAPRASFAIDSGDIAKDFALRNASGEIVTLGSIIDKSEIVLLEFFSVYCHTCREQVSLINRIAQQYPSRTVSVLAVAIENNQNELNEFIKQFGVSYQTLADPDKNSYYLYGVNKVPTVFLIDNFWIVRFRGSLEKNTRFEEKIASLLNSTGGVLQDGDIAPDFTLYQRIGEAVNLQTSYRQRRTVLGFFTADDAASQNQAATLERIHKEYQGQEIAVIGIATKGFRGSLDGFIQRSSVGFPVLQDKDGRVAESYKVSLSPEVFVINEEGRVRKKGPGISYAALLEVLEKEPGKPRVELSPDEIKTFLRQVIPQAESYDSVQVGGETIYVGTDKDGKKQYARFVKKDILCDVCADVHFVYALDESGIIHNMVMIERLERYGTPIEGREFLQQFIGTSYHETFRLGENVDGISGATKSSLKIVEALNETKEVFKKYMSDPAFDVSFRKQVCFKLQAEIESAIHRYNSGHREPMDTVNLQALAPYFASGTIPRCPGNGTYRLIPFNNMLRVMCTVHGLDPASSTMY